MTKFLRRYHDNFADDYGRMYGSYDGSIRCMNVSFIVTHECNLRCSYCYEHNKGGGEMDLDTAKKCVDLLFKMDRENHPYIETKGYDEIVKELTTGEDWLKMGEKELKQLRSAYDTDPSQSVAETYNTRLKQMQDGLNTYNSLIFRRKGKRCCSSGKECHSIYNCPRTVP